jgi:methyl-accepting chemotaxis protein
VAVAYAVVRLGRFIDEASVSLAALTTETTPLIKESTRTLELVNSPLESFAKISKNVEQVTTKVSEVATDFIDHSGPAVKVASALISAAQSSKGREKKKKKKAE